MPSPQGEGGVNIAPVAPPLEFPEGDMKPLSSEPSSKENNAQDNVRMHEDDNSQLAGRPSISKSMTDKPQRRPERLGPLHSRKTYGASAKNRTDAEWDFAPSRPGRPGVQIRSHTSRPGNRSRRGTVSSSDGNQAKIGPYPGLSMGNDQFRARGKVSKHDGRLNISLHEAKDAGYLAKAIGATIKRHLGRDGEQEEDADDGTKRDYSQDATADGVEGLKDHPRPSRAPVAVTQAPLPKLNLVVMVLGSRGDIQPFLRIGQLLKERYGHRVRIATHPAFKDFVEKDTNLEFFSVGGDPAELMAFMVKNPGLIPNMDTLKAGEIGKRREEMFKMFKGFWRACINATDDETNIDNLRMLGDNNPFMADAIIANPACFAHIHCAERLGVPLHLMFTFPQTPTTAFPNPLANIKKTNVDPSYTNFMSYLLVEMITWQGLGDLVNDFRVKTLGLEPVSTLWAPGQLYRQKVPFTYLWSPGLVPKPKDWGPEIDIAGFVFLDLASNFKPPESLVEFLEAGPPPLYIGFGSIVVDDPDRFTSIIFEAVQKTGVRALVSKGWGGLGGGQAPENVYMLENTPHDWIFPRVSAVIHHGGAGTTAIGLKCGKPTMVVPFFGDQPFWGAMIAKAGAGYHEPVPYKALTVERLIEGIQEILSPEAQVNAKKLADDIAAEGDGAENAVESFHRSLPLRGEHCMRCSMLEDHVAVWNYKKTSLKLSALAANILVERRKLHWRNLRLLRHYEWNDFSGPGEPFTGAGAAFINSVSGVAKGIGGVPVRLVRNIRRYERAKVKKARLAQHSNPDKSGTANGFGGPKKGSKNGIQGYPNGTIGQMEQDSQSISDDSASTDSSDISEGEEIAQDIARDFGKGLGKSGKAFVKAPMDLTLAVAQGFHNAPRLYGDSTVRPPTRISGFHSGVRAAGEEFAYGIYDGVTGLVLQPYHGLRDEGAIGFIKGMGKGVGGFVLKDLAAIIGPFGYTMKGFHKELSKGKGPTRFIRRARQIQGQQETRALSSGSSSANEEQKVLQTIDRGWTVFLAWRKFMGKKKEEGGVRGRLEYVREKKKWQDYEAFESIEQAESVLEARKRGEDVDRVFRRRKEELERSDAPKESAMADVKGTDARGQRKV
ncbi:MAG: hypothetical protein M1816_008039 [Peltula sp. TS41687]|nr:MAG: hypothetical protein M1816_008039 [Peltula sp. TS41687]